VVTTHVTSEDLASAAPQLTAAPSDGGRVEMIVVRPASDERIVLEQGEFTVADGLVGDDWRRRGSSRTADGSAHPDMQVTLVGRRFLELIAGARERWALAGDQLVVDLDLSEDNLPVGQQLAMGSAVFEVTPEPHTGCKKFAARFGVDALAFASTPEGRRSRLRGMYVRVVEPGTVAVGDEIRKRAPA
jgi:hypothetical protein